MAETNTQSHYRIITTPIVLFTHTKLLWVSSGNYPVLIKSSTVKMTKQSTEIIQKSDKEKEKINVLNMMLHTKKDTDIHEFARQLKTHLGDEFWVSIDNRPPAGPGNLRLFEENNFKLPRNMHRLYSDTNGISLTWGNNSTPAESSGHLGTSTNKLYSNCI